MKLPRFETLETGSRGIEMSENGNGKWALAFWLVTVICGTFLVGLTSAVVANDRIRDSEDTRIYSDLSTKIERMLESNQADHTSIKGDLREIKALMGRNNVVHNA